MNTQVVSHLGLDGSHTRRSVQPFCHMEGLPYADEEAVELLMTFSSAALMHPAEKN